MHPVHRTQFHLPCFPSFHPFTMADDELKTETFAFNADIEQLMSLIINTFYTNKDVFLRELISNASDALDKLRHMSLTNPSVLDDEHELHIRLMADRENNTLTIQDTGIGMSRGDLINNLGTIAKSGTKGFMESIQAGVDLSMIGQFGVGFYSAYLVADKVVVHSKKSNEEQSCWTSEAGSSFTITARDETDEVLTRGTRIVLHLKKDQHSYLEETTLRDLVRKHSGYTGFPIALQVTRIEEQDVAEEQDDAENIVVANDLDQDDDTDRPIIQDVADEGDRPPRGPMATIHTWEVLNQQKPIWAHNPVDVQQPAYAALYKDLSGDWEDHLAVKHFSAEGQLEFRAILFCPRRAPLDLFNGNTKRTSVKLYVRRVFVMDDCEDLIPEYLSFVKGVVDSEDLPLNISRESLQQNRIIRVIRKTVVRRCLEMFAEIAQDREAYQGFYTAFSKNIKLGITEDAGNRAKLVELLRFRSTASGEEVTSLREYVDRMQDGQKAIYYITGESQTQVEGSPFLEGLRDRGLEVLYMTDPMDEYAVQQLTDYDDRPLVCVTKEGLELDHTDKERKIQEQQAMGLGELRARIKTELGDLVDKVVLSDRLVESPCCLVTAEARWSANMERIMKAQAFRDDSMSSMMVGRKTLEINPEHPLVDDLRLRLDVNPQDPKITERVRLLFDVSLLTSGFSLSDPVLFGARIHGLMQRGLVQCDEGMDDTEEKDPLDTDTTMPSHPSTENHVAENLEAGDSSQTACPPVQVISSGGPPHWPESITTTQVHLDNGTTSDPHHHIQ